MSTQILYEQTKSKLYSWLEEVFETPDKIIGSIVWEPKTSDPKLCVSLNSTRCLIEKLEMGKNAENQLEKYKFDVLREYTTNPGICHINLDKLNDEQKAFLKRELEEHVQPLEEQISPYKDILSKLQS